MIEMEICWARVRKASPLGQNFVCAFSKAATSCRLNDNQKDRLFHFHPKVKDHNSCHCDPLNGASSGGGVRRKQQTKCLKKQAKLPCCSLLAATTASTISTFSLAPVLVTKCDDSLPKKKWCSLTFSSDQRGGLCVSPVSKLSL